MENKTLTKFLIIIPICFVLLMTSLAWIPIFAEWLWLKNAPTITVQVIDKRAETNGSFLGFETQYQIVFEGEDGDRITLKISEQDYGKFDIGGFYKIKIVHNKGTYVAQAEEWERRGSNERQ